MVNILEQNLHKIYNQFWNVCSYVTTYNSVRLTGTYMKTSQRSIPMYVFGSTIGASRYPLYYLDNAYHNLPRPYADFRPKSPARQFTDSRWFTTFVQDVEASVIYFLRELYPNKAKAKITLYKIAKAKEVIPNNCRISGTFFSHMTFLGPLSNNQKRSISCHKDEEDVITALFHVGKPTQGGNTNFYSGDSKKTVGHLTKSIPFQHGRLQIGFFDDVVHSADEWEGNRGGINFNLKKNMLKFFSDDELSKFYYQYENDGMPTTNYVAI